VQNWLRRAKLELAESKDYSFTRKYVSATLSAGDYRVGLPADYNGRAILRDTTNNNFVPIVGRNIFDARYPDLSEITQGDPEGATVKNMELWIAPPVDSSTVLELDYQRSGAETTADDFSWLPEIERFRCTDFAKAEAFDSMHMFDVADRYRQKWAAGMGKSVRADGRRKWRRRTSCLSVFQEYAMHNYQGN